MSGWPSASLALAGGTHGEKPCSGMGLVFMWEADEQVGSCFCFVLYFHFRERPSGPSDGKAQFSFVGRVQLVPVFPASCFPVSG